MRKYSKFMILAIFAFLMVSGATAQKKSKIVFLYGARSHASGDHEFKAGSMLLAKHLNAQKKVPVEAITHFGWPKDESILDDAAAVIIYSDATKVVQNGWEKMDALTKKGVGVMMMHYAVHPAIDKGEQYFMPWIGGYFRNNFSANPFWLADIKCNKDHECSHGVGEIRTIDEFYFNIKYSEKMIPLGVAIPTEKNLHHINNLWTKEAYESKDKPQALLWGTQREKGRGAGFTGGHHHHNWALDGYRQLVLNTIIWVAGLEVPKGGVPTYKVTEDELNENLDDYGARTKRIKLPDPKRLEFTPGPWMTKEEHADRRNRGKKKKKK